jgi:hypothetical protein
MQFQSPFISSIVGTTILFSILFSNTLSFCFSHNVTDQVLHPYQTSGKIIILFTLIFTFGPKRDEMTGGWRTLHVEELHNLYSSPNTITMIKSRNMKWVGNVARMGRRGMHTGFWRENKKEKDQ